MTQIDWQWLTSVGTVQEGALVVCPLSFDLGQFSSIRTTQASAGDSRADRLGSFATKLSPLLVEALSWLNLGENGHGHLCHRMMKPLPSA